MRKYVICLGVLLLLSGCSNTTPTNTSTSDTAGEEVIERNDIYRVALGDKELYVPFSVTELEEAGLKLSDSSVDTVMRGADNIAYYVDDEDGMIVVNLGTYVDSCELNEAYVIDILSDKGNTDSSILSVNGISFDSTKEEVEAVFGEPVFEDNGMTMYSRLEEGAYMDGAYVAMDGDEVIRVEVLSTKDFVDWDPEEMEEFESESESE